MYGLVTDLRSAVRNLWKRPGFLVAAIATLAIGIGANATVFSFVDALLLRPLPFGDRSDRVVTLHWTHPTLAPDYSSGTMSYGPLRDLVKQTSVFENVGGYIGRNVVITGRDTGERVRGGSITPRLFEVLGIQPMAGRGFVESDAAVPGFEQVVILSHGLWVRSFGADPSLVGRPIQLNGRSITVIGVMPPGFRFPERDDLWLPFRPESEQLFNIRNLLGVAALSPGISIEQAQRELDRISANLQKEFPEIHRDWVMRVVPFRTAFVGAEARILFGTLLGAVAFVLAIGCANLTNLLLARGFARQREMAIRAAIGAGRLRLVRQMIVEAFVVSTAGGFLGFLGATWAAEFIVAASPEGLPHWAQIRIDARLILFTLSASVAAMLMFGLWPAFRASRPNLVDDLKEAGPRTSASRRQHRLKNGLVVAQIAMCLAMLVGANMMIRSFMQMMNADAGFDDSHLLSFRIMITGDQYDPNEAKTSFVRDFENELRNIPGVVSAGATTAIPIDDGGGPQRVAIEGLTRTADEQIGASAIYITPGFFESLGLKPIEGRAFTQVEVQNTELDVVMVNRGFAREFFPNDTAVGRRIALQTQRGPRWLRIVGVVPDIQFEEFGEETAQSRRNIYYPYGSGLARGLAFMVRTQGDSAVVLNSVRATLRRIDRNLPVFELRTMSGVRADTTFEQRVIGQMMGVFGGIALFLACLGLYGVMTYSVRQRTWEIGLRVALGADSRQVVRMILRQGARTALTGIAVGMVLSIIVGRLIAGVLYRVSAMDPFVFAGTAALLVAVTLFAVYLPARQASKVDPIAALRSE